MNVYATNHYSFTTEFSFHGQHAINIPIHVQQHRVQSYLDVIKMIP